MGQVYKGYELIKAITERKIRNGTRFREGEEGRYYKVKDFKLFEETENGLDSMLDNLQIMYGCFELIEEQEIDIQSIDEFEFGEIEEETNYETRRKINELIKSVKQLDKKINE